MNNRTNKRKGFTLIELSVVIAIIALLASFVAPMVSVQITNKKIKATEDEMKNIKTALGMFYEDVYEFNVGHQLPASLAGLETNPFIIGNERYLRWDGPYMVSVFGDYTQDEWNTSYVYNFITSSCTISSYGPDRASGGGDDISLTIMYYIGQKIARVREELEVIKESAHNYFLGEDTYPTDIHELFSKSYLADESYKTDEWGSDYVRITVLGTPDSYYFISIGPDLIASTVDDIDPY